jgi:hypothetical protein
MPPPLPIVTIVVCVVITTKPIVTPSLMVSSKIEPLEFFICYYTLDHTLNRCRSRNHLISNTFHALKVFVTPTTTFVRSTRVYNKNLHSTPR